MKVEVHERFESVLPPDDDTHPYRTGAWRPQTTEYDAWDLDVEGEIPDDLSGVYLRNTENPLLPPIDRYDPFDGDAMVHAMSFGGGDAVYRNRFVRTEGLMAEPSRRLGRPTDRLPRFRCPSESPAALTLSGTPTLPARSTLSLRSQATRHEVE